MTTEGFHRKLTAILSADVQGYSRLMEEDEESTVLTLTAYRELMSVLIERHQGRVVDSPGDNLLAEFESLTDAVHCSVEIQEELRIRNADLPDNRKMLFRIGINLGEIIEDRDHIYGDGVNVAARVECQADGGGICISGAVYDAIKNKLSMSYEFMGEYNVKNIKEPVRIYRIKVEPEAESAIKKEKKERLKTWQWVAVSVAAILIFAAVSIWFFFFRQASVFSDVEEGTKTIAVLPFENLSSDPEQVYFVDGLSEEILNSLAQIQDLNVIGRTSSFSFKGSNKTVQEIASVLGADYILEGSVRKAGNALRITAQMLRATDSVHLWSKIYERELKDIFAVQEDIANSVADELKVTLGIGKSFRQLGGTDKLESYGLYLFAQGQLQNPTQDQTERALKAINEAVTIDPKFALAWARKSFIHTRFATTGPVKRSALELDAALNAAQKAIELEPNLAEGHYQLGWLKTLRGDWIEAELDYRKALELTTEPSAIFELPLHYFAVGHLVKSRELLEEYLQKDPVSDPMVRFYIQNLTILGDMQRAEEEIKHYNTLFGAQWFVEDGVTNYFYFGTSDYVTLNQIICIDDPICDATKEHLESPKEAIKRLRRLYTDENNRTTSDFMHIGILAAYFGDPEFAMDAMEKEVSLIGVDFNNAWLPVFKEVRQTPRFKEFVKEIGLVNYWNRFGWPDLCRPLDNGDFECE